MNLKKVMGYALGPFGAAALGFISLPVMAWFFSTEDIGRISMLQIFSTFSILFFCLGLDQAYVREFHESDDKESLFKSCFLPGFIFCLIFFSILFVFNSRIISIGLYNINSIYISCLSIICFLFAFIIRFLGLILRMQDKALLYSISQITPKVFFINFIFIIYFLNLDKSFKNLIIGQTFSLFFCVLILLWNNKDALIKIIKAKFSVAKFKEVIKFGSPLIIGGLASWGLNVTDKLMLKNLADFNELGLYSMAFSIAGVATIFAGVFNTIWSPMVFKWISGGDVNYRKICDIQEYVLCGVYFLIVLSGLFSWLILLFLPDNYYVVQYIITSCLLVPFFYTLSEVSSVGIAISRKTLFSMYASFIALILSIILNYFLIPILGAAGAAIASSIAFWLFLILRTEFSNRCWINIKTGKLYIITLILLCVALLNSLQVVSSFEMRIIWLSLLVFGCFVFKNSIKMILSFFYKTKLV
ncbi:oligosaccharide flippase family protein [Acinetobacter baumannii]|nr:oligosaccharide flippase family protein [Acinetobacter baumannii]